MLEPSLNKYYDCIGLLSLRPVNVVVIGFFLSCHFSQQAKLATLHLSWMWQSRFNFQMPLQAIKAFNEKNVNQLRKDVCTGFLAGIKTHI